MKNVQKPEKIHLDKLISEIGKGRYVIPDFQRDFEWEPWDVRDLIKSIFMDYYIGTLLLWEGTKHNFEILSCTKIYGFEGRNSDPGYIVLDGQQRLTAMHYAFFQPQKNFPKRKSPFYFFIRINELLDKNYEDAFFYKNKSQKVVRLLNNNEQQYKEHLFPLGVMKGGSWDIIDWIKGYREYWHNIYDGLDSENAYRKEVKGFIENARRFKEEMDDFLQSYNISYIELDDDIEVGKVCDIFTHINSRGVRLDIFDLLNAVLRPKEIKLKEMWEKASVKLDFTDPKKMKVYILQVMSILEQSYCSPMYLYYLVPGAIKKVKQPDGSKTTKILIKDKQEFEQRWLEATATLENTIKMLRNPRELGAIQPNFVPYPSIIPILSAVKRYVEKSDQPNKVDIHGKIRAWYWASIFLNRYSSAVESTSAKDFIALKKWFADDSLVPELIGEFLGSYTQLDLKRENQKGSAIYKAIYNIFIINGARDWETFALPEYDALDDHHIVPRSWGKDKVGHDINSVLNKTPLSRDTNRNIIRAQLPNVYMKRMLKNNEEDTVYAVLASHLISREAVDILLRNPFEPEDYYAFIEERKKAIIRAIGNIVSLGNVNIPLNIEKINNRIEQVELALRELIADKLDDVPNPYKKYIPSAIQNKVNQRVEGVLKKNPGLARDNFKDFRSMLPFFDLQEYLQIMINSTLWKRFEPIMRNKNELTIKFNQLSGLRNPIRHSRFLSEIDQKEGEAALLWFEEVLGL